MERVCRARCERQNSKHHNTSSYPRNNTKLFVAATYRFLRFRHFQTKANFYNTLILKTENGGFSTFAGVFDPGNGKIGLAFLKVRRAFGRDASSDVCRFFRIEICFFSIHHSFLNTSFRRYLSKKNRSFFRMKRQLIHIRNWFCDIFYKILTDILKKRQMTLDAFRKKVSRTLREAGPILPFPG